MRQRWFGGLALSLGVAVLGHLAMALLPLRAEEPGPIIQPYPPVPTQTSRSQEDVAVPLVQSLSVLAPAAPPQSKPEGDAEPDPAVTTTLDRPVAIRPAGGIVDNDVRPTGLFGGRQNIDPVSGGVDSFSIGQGLPVGPNNSTILPAPAKMGTATPSPAEVPYTWRQPPSPTGPTAVDPSTALPLPSPAGPIADAPMETSGPMLGGDCGSPGCTAPGCTAQGCCGPMGCGMSEGCDGCGCGWNDYCGCGHRCCFGNRWYGSAEYLLWFIRGQPLPPLLTTGPLTGHPPGAIGQPGTQVLFGGTSLNQNPYSGARLRLGYWFNDTHGLGLEIGGFFLGGNANRFTMSSLGTPFLARPFFNALTGKQDIEAVATPNGLTGTFNALNTFILFGAEANLRRNLFCGCNWYFDAFAGWRLLGLNEALSVNENLSVASSTNPSLPAGTRFLVSDRFGTTNLFNGGQIGGIFEYRVGRWSVDIRTSVALGGTQENVSISGSTLAQVPGQQGVLATGGLLAQTSNIGHYSRDIITVVPEVGINLGYQFTNHIRGFVGYNFLYWSNVVRPGNQVDLAVNPNLIPPTVNVGPQKPTFNFHGSDFWAQGINFGLDIRW